MLLYQATQWYQVYQDPEDTHSLEKNDDTDATNNEIVVTNLMELTKISTKAE